MQQIKDFFTSGWLFLPPLILLIAGCSGGAKIRFSHKPGAKANLVGGKHAVLVVHTDDLKKGYAADWYMGRSMVVEPDIVFTRLFAEINNRRGWLDVISPEKVEQSLREAGLKPTSQPPRDEIERRARVAGCDRWLEVDIREWGVKYFLAFARTRFSFSIKCYKTGRDEPLWEAQVKQKGKAQTEREVAVDAFQNLYNHLAERL